MIKIKDLKKIKILQQLEKLNIGNIDIDISHRGGHLGFSGNDVADFFDIPYEYLPLNFGAYCNYLGGGIRGSIQSSTFFKGLYQTQPQVTRLLEELGKACIRVYEKIDKETVTNDLMEGIVRVNQKSAY